MERLALVIGAGPAGLMAAEELARAGHRVVVAEARPSAGRKFLMAGKSGLNLTKDEPLEAFCQKISAEWLRPIVAEFGPAAVAHWARHLGQEVYTGSSGRVFPVVMKASPLLRAWIGQLVVAGVEIRTRWRWIGFEGASLVFETPDGRQAVRPSVTVLALGGASWPRLGSDAAWVPWLTARGVDVTSFRPANMGFTVDWTPHMQRFFGQPVKGTALAAAGQSIRAEFMISKRGLEGGAIYALSAAMRDGAELSLDLAPDMSFAGLAERLMKAKPGDSIGNRLRKAANLDAVKVALLQEWARPLPGDPTKLAEVVKHLTVVHRGPRPIEEAISSAGGIAERSLTGDLELKALPDIFAAGEMLDWEAPTGGYLLTACLATGRHAGRAAAQRLRERP